MKDIRVRYAPSPTGVPHIGNTRTALYNFLFAKREKGQFILRIEDTDQSRLVPDSIAKIEESLRVLGLVWDEKYMQSKRLDIYAKNLEILKSAKVVYQDAGAWKFKVAKNKKLQWIDVVHGKVQFKSDVIEDFVIIKSDKFPTYHFASVVDDHEMQITNVIRGDEWISSTPKHLLLYESFGWQPPTFVHIPPILSESKKKLSKREGAKSVLEYIDEGYLPEALVNFLALLGWAPKDDRELFTLDELVGEFSLDRLNKNSPIFNLGKLNWFNRKYLQKLTTEVLLKKIKEFYLPHPVIPASSPVIPASSPVIPAKAGIHKTARHWILDQVENDKLEKILHLVRDRLTTLADFDKYAAIFFQKGDKTPPSKEKIQNAKQAIESVAKWDEQSITVTLNSWILKQNLESADFKNTLRLAVFADNTPPIYQSLAVLTKEEVLRRIDDAIKKSK